MRHRGCDTPRCVTVVVIGACLALARGVSCPADAQSIDTYHLQPAPDGTNIIEAYGAFDHFSGFQFSNGQTVPNTHLNEGSATIRYAHYIYIDGHPAGLQLFQSVNYFTDLQFNDYNENNAPALHRLGVGGTTLSASSGPTPAPSIRPGYTPPRS